MAHILHPEYFRSPFGADPMEALQGHIDDFAAHTLDTVPQPDISVVIQSRDDGPDDINRLLDDIEKQVHPGGVQKILVNSGNAQDTLDAAKSRGVEVVPARSRVGFRSDILNRGIEAADNNVIFTTVGHAALSSDLTLSVAAHYGAQESVGGAFGIALPDRGATIVERSGAVLLGAKGHVSAEPGPVSGPGMGLLASDCSVVKKELILGLGGYPTDYGAGGGDGKIGQQLIELNLDVTRDPLLSVHHTHGFGPIKALRQALAWRGMDTPQPYQRRKWDWHPHGGL